MCGVIGYTGGRVAQERLLRGLERLEYRGYDSSGIGLLDEDGLDVVRAVGKLGELRAALGGRVAPATAGIGHTRWATHGRVTERNAHPLPAGQHDDVAIVLNGIVENHGELRRELQADGARFASETDAEVVAHLVRRAFAGDLTAAVRAARARLEGHFAFIAVHREAPGVLVGTRQACPLLVGLGDGEAFLASSIAAFAGDADRVGFLDDGDVVTLTPAGVRALGADGRPRELEVVDLPEDEEVAERGGFETYMLKEMHEQPAAVAATIERNLALDLGEIGRAQVRAARRVVLLGCGTAYHAGLVARHAVEAWADLACDPEVASEWRYRAPRLDPDTLVVAVSQSGETADTLAALRMARELGAPTLAVTNSPGSQITREADGVLLTHAGLEMGVAATKTFTTQVVLLQLLALRLGELRGTLPAGEHGRLLAELRALPAKLESCLEGDEAVEEFAERHHDKPFFFFLGRHAGVPVAQEGALKLKEIAYVPTESYAAGEMKHGPIALLDDDTPVVCVATRSHVGDKLASNLQEVRARGAQVLAVATRGDETMDDVAEDVVRVPPAHPLLQPVLAVVPLQLLAYRIAALRGLDVDQPRNLAKTVTVE
jgi:glucosamine--fructose-6-phosphate aminotransferase (isomerizing)